MEIIKQELQFEGSPKQRLEFIHEFSKVIPTIINGSIRKIEKLTLHILNHINYGENKIGNKNNRAK